MAVSPPQRPAASARSAYRPEIDGLRALAVVVVIVNHFQKSLLPSGYLGVDIFFVISGYVITASLVGRQSKGFPDFLAGFYERRIKRLLPALVAFVLVVSLCLCLFNPDPGAMLEVGLKALFGVSNITLYKASTDYFAASTELNPFTHTWSLGVEEQFYLLFPFLVWFSGFARQARNGARNLFLWVATLSAFSLLGFIYLYQVNQPAAYFLMPSRFWELAAGCLVYVGFRQRAAIERVLECVPPLLVIAAMGAVMLLPQGAAVAATLLIVSLTAVLLACLKRGTAAFRLFADPRVVYVGRISYSLYLWHWGVLSLARWTVGVSVYTAPLLILLMLLAAVFSYHCIETPLRSGLPPLPRRTVLIVGLASVMAAAFLMRLVQQGSMRLFAMANPQLTLFEQITPAGRVNRQWLLRESAVAERSSGMGRPLPTAAVSIKGCFKVTQIEADDLTRCLAVVGDDAARPHRVFILGDSHATAFAPGIVLAFPQAAVRQYLAAWGCGYLPEDVARQRAERTRFNCPNYSRNVDRFVRENLRPSDLVVLAIDWRTGAGKKNAAGMAEAVLSLASRVTARGASFVLFDDVPELGEPLVCQRTWYRPNPPATCRKTIKQVAADQAQLDAIGARLAALPGSRAHYVSLRANLCQNQQDCSIYLDGRQIFRDNGHITQEAALRHLTEPLRRALTPLLFPRSTGAG